MKTQNCCDGLMDKMKEKVFACCVPSVISTQMY